jgi:hypothetical protein
MSRPTLDGIKQASSQAFSKAQLMVGLKNEEDVESQEQSEPSVLESAADLLCPELTFQQRLIGFATCFTIGCKSFGGTLLYFLMTCNSISLWLISFLPRFNNYRFDYIHVLQVLCSINRRVPGPIRSQLFLWKSSGARFFLVSLWSQTTIQKHV